MKQMIKENNKLRVKNKLLSKRMQLTIKAKQKELQRAIDSNNKQIEGNEKKIEMIDIKQKEDREMERFSDPRERRHFLDLEDEWYGNKEIKYGEIYGVGKKECDQCGKKNMKLLKCSYCKKVRYCSRKCQKKAWRFRHRKICSWI
eukprot:436083_1